MQGYEVNIGGCWRPSDPNEHVRWFLESTETTELVIKHSDRSGDYTRWRKAAPVEYTWDIEGNILRCSGGGKQWTRELRPTSESFTYWLRPNGEQFAIIPGYLDWSGQRGVSKCIVTPSIAWKVEQ